MTAGDDGSGIRVISGPGPVVVWVESARIDECIAFARQQGSLRIALAPYMGFEGHDLEFLADHPDVRGVTLANLDDADVGGLRFLEGSLESLHLGENRQPIDFSRFPHLERLQTVWHPGLTIESASLRALVVHKYKPKTKDLQALPSLPALDDLALTQSPIETLRGIGRFPNLGRLFLGVMSKLGSIADIAELADGRLEILECHGCRKMADHEAVRKVRSLRVLRFNNCGEIPNLGFLDDLPHLGEFRFVDTNIADGDLRPLLRLESVGFFKKKHYSHTPEEVDAIIGRSTSEGTHDGD